MKRPWCIVLSLIYCSGDGFHETSSTTAETTYRCSSNYTGIFQAPGEGGGWENAGQCEGDCADGQCVDSACPDEGVERCTANGQVERCDPAVGGFLFQVTCDNGQTCVASDDEGAAGCQPLVCTPGFADCVDAATARLCNDKGSVFEETPCSAEETCMSGACLSVCDIAKQDELSQGCTFYALDADNLDSPDDDYQYSIVVANPDDADSATVELDYKVGDDWLTFPSVTVLPGQAHTLYVTCSGGEDACQPDNLMTDRHPEGTGLFSGLAFRLRASRPVAAYQINSDDVNFVATSTGATILYPLGAVDRHYFAVSYPHSQTGAGWVAIVATEDSTTVTTTLSAETMSGGGVPAYRVGDVDERVLDQGDVLQFATGELGSDLTGTYVEANNDIAVFSGHEDAWVGGIESNRDHIEEQMMPVDAWGKSHVASAAPLCLTDCAGTACPYESSTVLWRVLASEDDTIVSFAADDTLRGVPSADVPLDRGAFFEFTVLGNDLNRGHFGISANEPILVAQYLASGPTAMVLIAPDEQLLPRYGFATTEWFSDVLTITRPTGSSVWVDETAPVGSWTAATEAHDVLSLGICADGISHTVDGSAAGKQDNFGIIVSGNGGSCSYAFLGGLRQGRINPIE